MASPPPDILTLTDDLGLPYLAFNPLALPIFARPLEAASLTLNTTTFLSETLPVSPLATGLFSTDLTSRDDVILAISSLLLILTLEAILTTLLLRSHHHHHHHHQYHPPRSRSRPHRRTPVLSNLAFSLKHFHDLTRDLRFRHLLPVLRSLLPARFRPSPSPTAPAPAAAPPKPHPPHPVRPRLVLLALLTVTSTFALELLILVLTSPTLVNVDNATASFQLVDAVNPDWNQVRDNIGAAVNRPCTSITLLNVDQHQTILSPCLTVNGRTVIVDSFPPARDNISLTLVSDIHAFGADHQFTIHDQSLTYLTRAYFRLGDSRNRMMKMRRRLLNNEARIAFLHRQFVAYLFNVYARETRDARVDLDRLSELRFQFSADVGPDIQVIQLNRRTRYNTVTSTRHVTNVSGIIPHGTAALQFAQAFLKGATGVQVTGPDLFDLQMGSGNTAGERALMWRESARVLNWLTLNVILAGAVVVFAVLRWVVRGVGAAELAELYVVDAVGAVDGRPVGYLSGDEKRWFRVPGQGGDDEGGAWRSEEGDVEEYSDVTSSRSAAAAT